MRRRIIHLFCAVVLAVVGLASDSPKDYDDTTRMDPLQGTWHMAVIEYNGNRERVTNFGTQTFRGDRWTFVGRENMEGTFTARNDRLPATFDETWTTGSAKGQTWQYIYQVEGDTLRTTHRPNGQVRPKSFDEDGAITIIWKRATK
jgi:uncharacterized protein (TIGR03067 family)